MANNKKAQNFKEVEKAGNQSSVAINGTDMGLDMENIQLRNILRQTAQRTAKKYGNKTDNRPLGYFTEIGMASLLADATADKANSNTKGEVKQDPKKLFKKYMTDKEFQEGINLAVNDLGKFIEYQNYEAIEKHIPECSTALRIYTNNVLSPDDFTKKVFLYNYTAPTDEETKNGIYKNIEELIKKYKLNKKTISYIKDALLYGDNYIAVLSLEDELDYMMSDSKLEKGILQENIDIYDTDKIDITVSGSDVSLNESQKIIMQEFCDNSQIVISKDSTLQESIAKIINEHFVIDSKLSMLQERAEYEYDKMRRGIVSDLDYEKLYGKKKNNKEKNDNKPMFVSGSVIRQLDPARVIPLEIDDICYGYYYIEEKQYNNTKDVGQAGDYLGMVNQQGQNNVVSIGATGATIPVDKDSSKYMEDYKVKIVSDVFLNTLSKKINREYVRHNKQFKDFIYSIVKQKYFMEKQIHMTYFSPEEVIHFKVPPVYKNITFFAKLYLAMLTNAIVINMGRGHDKRVFYVASGLDASFEEAISNTIEAIKSKEFKLNDSDINTILQLNPGALDDYFIPTINGDRAIEIDTLAGMDIDIANNAFLDWLKKSMMNGMYIPAAIIDQMADIDYARQLSAQNANFTRQVISYQLELQEPFTKLIQRLYWNEYRFSEDGKSNLLENINLDKIEVFFPSPASLNMTNLQEQINTASAMADELSAIIVPPKQDGSTDDKRLEIKAAIFKDYCPFFDFEKYQKMAEAEVEQKAAKKKIKKKIEDSQSGSQDNYSNDYGY